MSAEIDRTATMEYLSDLTEEFTLDQIAVAKHSKNLSKLSPADRTLFYHYGRALRKSTPFSLVLQAFEYYANLQPSALALEHDGRHLTYGELDRQANRLSKQLIARSLVPR